MLILPWARAESSRRRSSTIMTSGGLGQNAADSLVYVSSGRDVGDEPNHNVETIAP